MEDCALSPRDDGDIVTYNGTADGVRHGENGDPKVEVKQEYDEVIVKEEYNEVTVKEEYEEDTNMEEDRMTRVFHMDTDFIGPDNRGKNFFGEPKRMSCEVETNIERLIQLVEERNCIWDISSENYKDKNLKKEAWREICEELIIGFNDLDNKEMIEKCRSLQVKWKNVRERYLKLLRIEKNAASGSGASCKKPYAYSKHLDFLKKLGSTAQTTSSLANDGDGQGDSSTNMSSMSSLRQGKPSAQKQNRSQTSPFEQELLKKLDTPEEQSTHMAFMKGIEPSLQTLTADEVLEWQHSAIEALLSIKKRKRYQNPVYLSGQQASSSFTNQSFNWQNPTQNVIPDPMCSSPPMHHSAYQTCPQTTVPVASPVDSISSEVSSLLDL